MKPQAIIFDAYGTLFDVHSVMRRAGSAQTDMTALSFAWRQKQIEYTWRRALMKRYADFWQVTGEALHAAARKLQLKLSQAEFDRLMEAYLSPEAYSDVRTALDSLRAYALMILSNGSSAMLDSAVRANRLEPYFSRILSVDERQTYKPAPEVYALGTEALGVSAREMLFVSSNAWDIAGAKAFGYRTCWCNRSSEPEDCIGFDPDFIITGLGQITDIL
jgi:2-haloacid dehalogenase